MSKTKTDYRQYIASADWQERRREFLETNNACARCEMPRWLAEIAYDQDLNVHHKSYANLGSEDFDDLEPLCRRCHEIHKFGRSELREPKSSICIQCSRKHWNPYLSTCDVCETVFGTKYLENKLEGGSSIGEAAIAFFAALCVLRGYPRDAFLKEMNFLYKCGVKAAPQIKILRADH